MSVPHQLRRVRLRAKTSLSPPPPPGIRYRPFQGGGSDVVLMWFSVVCFGVSFGDVHLMFVHYTFNSVLVAEWPPFGK